MDLNSSWIIVLPARRHSTRLAEKLLRADSGRPLLAHTVQTAQEALGRHNNAVWVACDDTALAKVAKDAGANVVMVTQWCDSGTERIWRALPELPPVDIIVNLQADEPEMPIAWIHRCAAALEESRAAVATVATPLTDGDPAFEDPNVVKVVTDNSGCALYFSRAAIPILRTGGKAPNPRGLRHVGLYAYRTEFLQAFGDLPASSLEDSECLEQLRFLQAGYKIQVIVAEDHTAPSRGVDTEEDYRSFVSRWRARHG